MLRCNNCGSTGQHITSECPYSRGELASPGKPWCGNCDKRTRLVDYGDRMARCAECHPLAWKTLPQHRRCGGCNHLVYAWEAAPCGEHRAVA